jgi:pyruvate,water dikinase
MLEAVRLTLHQLLQEDRVLVLSPRSVRKSAVYRARSFGSATVVALYLVDLGGGISAEAAASPSVRPEEVVSIPFGGLFRGLGDERFEPARADGSSGAFAAVLATTMVASGPRELGAPNYACVTENYLNLNSRQAYHFAIVDSYLSANQNSNHVSLRLKGGGAPFAQRNLRAEFVAAVLRQHHFAVHVAGDLVNGWARGIDIATGTSQLEMIGRLLRFLAQLDMYMTREMHVKEYVDTFMGMEAAARSAPSAEPGADSRA